MILKISFNIDLCIDSKTKDVKSVDVKNIKVIDDDVLCDNHIILKSSKLIIPSFAINMLKINSDDEIIIEYLQTDKVFPVIYVNKNKYIKGHKIILNSIKLNSDELKTLTIFGTEFDLKETDTDGVFMLVGLNPKNDINDQLTVNIDTNKLKDSTYTIKFNNTIENGI